MHFFPGKRLSLILLGLLWLEFSLLPILTVGQIKPDFFLIFLVFYAFRINWKRIVTLAFFVGLIQDLTTNSFFGLETASCVGASVLLRFVAIRLDRDKTWIQGLSLFCFSWLALTFFSLGASLTQGTLPADSSMVLKNFSVSVYTTAAGFLLFPLLERWLKPALYSKQYELF